jgi:XTP/dITP diphosphohydrolase
VRLTLLVTTPRVAPGLMTRAAWQAVEEADVVAASSADLPLARAVRAAGIGVSPLAGRLVDLLALAGRSDVVYLTSDEEADRLPHELAALVVDQAGRSDPADPAPRVEVLHASYDVPGARLLDLVTVMDRLRRECPWDREQTHRSLATYLLEETYETLEAIDTGDAGHLREELGDLLLQVLFHARIAEEDPGGFTVDDVAAGIVDKLVYRHPHVFAGLDVEDAAEVDRNWEALKAAEKQRSSPVEGIPRALPALAYAEKVVGRLAKAGALPDEPAQAAGAGDGPGPDLGAALLRLVVASRSAGLDAEQELRDAVRRLIAATS